MPIAQPSVPPSGDEEEICSPVSTLTPLTPAVPVDQPYVFQSGDKVLAQPSPRTTTREVVLAPKRVGRGHRKLRRPFISTPETVAMNRLTQLDYDISELRDAFLQSKELFATFC